MSINRSHGFLCDTFPIGGVIVKFNIPAKIYRPGAKESPESESLMDTLSCNDSGALILAAWGWKQNTSSVHFPTDLKIQMLPISKPNTHSPNARGGRLWSHRKWKPTDFTWEIGTSQAMKLYNTIFTFRTRHHSDRYGGDSGAHVCKAPGW